MPTLIPIALAVLAWADPPPAHVPAPAPRLSPQEVVEALESAVADAIARAEPSVVAVAREKSEHDETTAVRGREPVHARGFDRRLLPEPFQPPESDVLSFDYGSGVVVGDNGEILTAYHVVRGAAKLTVRAENRQQFEAEVIAADPRSDLAVIAPRDDQNARPKLRKIAIGDATRLRKGAFLVALGNPFNAARDGKPSASWGILSNTARKIDPTLDEKARGELQLRNYPTLLQLDSKLNLGMSGGAVVNLKGELVGVTTAAANAAGFDAQAGYAIPMDILGRKVVESLRQGKEYEYGFLGIKLDMQTRTSRVSGAEPGSPAADGGVQVHDQIVAVGEIPVTDSESLVVAINSVPAGEPVTLKLVRQGGVIERTVTLAKLKVRGGPVIATNRPEPWRGVRVDYTSTLANTTFAPEAFEAMARRGVLVTEVESGSEAEKAGLKPNQLITRVEGRPVPSPREFARAVAGLKGPVRLETDQGVVTVK
jgi:S1-C subfamily serine protease